MPRAKRKPFTHKKKRTVRAVTPELIEIETSLEPSPWPSPEPSPEPESPLAAKSRRAKAAPISKRLNTASNTKKKAAPAAKKVSRAVNPKPVEEEISTESSPEPETPPVVKTKKTKAAPISKQSNATSNAKKKAATTSKKAASTRVVEETPKVDHTTLRRGRPKNADDEDMDLDDSDEDEDMEEEELQSILPEVKRARGKPGAKKKADAPWVLSPKNTNYRVTKKQQPTRAAAKKLTARETKFQTKNALGGYLAEGFIINEMGAIVEAEPEGEDDFSNDIPVHSVERVTDLGELAAIRVQDLRQFIKDKRIHQNQMKNIDAIIACYEKDGQIVPWQKPKNRRTAGEKEFEAIVAKLARPWEEGTSYWFNGGQISEFQRLTVKSDNNLWIEPSLLDMDIRRSDGGDGSGAATAATAGAQAGKGKNPRTLKKAHVGSALRTNGQHDDLLTSAVDTSSTLLDGLVNSGLGLQTLDLSRAVMQHNASTSGIVRITVAIKYPPNDSTARQDAGLWSSAANPNRVVIDDMFFDTACTWPSLNQHVVDELNLRWTLHTLPQAMSRTLADGTIVQALAVPVMFMFLMDDHPASPWIPSPAIIPAPTDSNGYARHNLSGFTMTGALNWLIARDTTNESRVVYAAREYGAIDHCRNQGLITTQ